jgi:hypothetical protein
MARNDTSDETTADKATTGAARRPRRPLPAAPSGLDLERALTTKETGGILGHSDITLQQWRAQGNGPRFFRVGGGKRPAIRYRLGDVLAFRDAKMVGKAS